MTLYIASWVAIIVLSIGYWVQVWRIHVHKEVRDLSLTYYVMMAVGFAILGATAFIEHSVLFLVKQIATTIPSVVIILQILYHRKDRWYDPELQKCEACAQLLENRWRHCPFCGHRRNRKPAEN